MPRDWNAECQQPTCRHPQGMHAEVGDWCAKCAVECMFLPPSAAKPMFDFNLASKPRKRAGLVRFAFRCGCRAEWSPLLERLEELRFCQKDDCPASQYAKTVYEEYLTERYAREHSEFIKIPEELVTQPGTTVGVLGMLAGLIKRGG